ncbi:MAG: 2-oxoacid:ferredoxin oxidoreductase subunit beta [Ardenticatenia bacterium]|nr:MAG: 2-oxoacid:ferredoxin oxidoreductase subunit beta [Ardenticatenia bacterium]
MTVQNVKVTPKLYRPPHPVDWCPGCGDFGILSSLQRALAQLGLLPHQVAVFGGIGCSGKAPYYVSSYGVHTLHGRVLPYAQGAKLANPELTVVAVGGDGDGLGIGAAHFVNAGRRNIDMTYILFNNEVYGLTKGQAAPTMPLGMQTKALPEPNMQNKINSLMLALTSGFTWIGRGYAYNVKQLVKLMQEAIQHPGLSYLEVLQPCPTYNNIHTKEWYNGEDLGHPRVYDVQEEGYDPVIPEGADEETINAKMLAFMQKANEWGDRIPTGILLQNRAIPTYEERISQKIPSYRSNPPAVRDVRDENGYSQADLSPFYEELAINY